MQKTELEKKPHWYVEVIKIRNGDVCLTLNLFSALCCKYPPLATKSSVKSIYVRLSAKNFAGKEDKGFAPFQDILRKERGGRCRNWSDSGEVAGSKE